MNRRIAAVVAAAAIAAGAALMPASPAQSAPAARHRVVFELTSSEPAAWEGVLNNVENVKKAFGAEPVEIEVVTHGKGLGLLIEAKNGTVRDRVTRIAQSGVVFAACRNTMTRESVTEAQLSKVAKTVDSGVAEVVRKQEADWSYLRSGS